MMPVASSNVISEPIVGDKNTHFLRASEALGFVHAHIMQCATTCRGALPTTTHLVQTS